jgi:hypothetical protein
VTERTETKDEIKRGIAGRAMIDAAERKVGVFGRTANGAKDQI